MFLEYTLTVVVSAPMSTSVHPERRSASVSTLSAKAKGAKKNSAILMFAVSKHLLRFLLNVLRCRIFRKLPSMREHWIPTGSSCSCESTLYYCTDASRISWSGYFMFRLASISSITMSCVTCVSPGRSLVITLRIERIDWPPTPT